MSCINCFPSPDIYTDKVVHREPFQDLPRYSTLDKILENFKSGGISQQEVLDILTPYAKTNEVLVKFQTEGDKLVGIVDGKYLSNGGYTENINSALDFSETELSNGLFLVGGSTGNTSRKIVKEDLNMGNSAVLSTNSSGVFSGISYSTSATANTMAQRDASGRIKVADASASGDAVNKGQLEARTPIGTNRQVMGYEDGVIKAVTLGWMEFSDLPNPPTFNTGVVAGTTFNPDGSAMFYFQEINDAIDGLAKERTIPMYGTGGVLKVADGISENDAVSMAQYNALLARIEALENQ